MRFITFVAVAWLFGSVPAEATEPQRGCVVVHATARYVGAGYNHIASTENGCARPVQCGLWSDVDPQPQYVVELEPNASADTVFRIDSPAYGFRVYYRCQWR